MTCMGTREMSDEYYEEEVIEEYVDVGVEDVDDESMGDEDFLAYIKNSLQAEARKLKAATDANASTKVSSTVPKMVPAPAGAPAHLEDEEVEYEEVEYDQGSFLEQEVDVAEDLDDEDYMESIQSSMQALFRERKAAAAAAAVAAAANSKSVPKDLGENDDGSDYEYEEYVIERWFERDPEPADMEAACRALIPIVYKGENMSAETMMRRTPLPELYRYLKQHYDYKKEVKQDLTDEETKSGETQTTLENLFKKRSVGNGASSSVKIETAAIQSDKGMPGERGSNLLELIQAQSHGDISKKDPHLNSQAGEHKAGFSCEDSQVLEEEVLVVDSTTDLGTSCILMGESGRSFEEFIDETENEEIEIEESIREETECEIVEETLREDDIEDVCEEIVRG